MGKKLAIKGHATRGEEVIELLEMLGGKNVEGFIGADLDELYTIEDNYIIQAYDWNNCVCFTLEEFLEKYPFKIGDIVDRSTDYVSCVINNIRWNSEKCCIEYHLNYFNGSEYGWHGLDCLIKPEDVITETKVESTGFMQLGKTFAVIFNDANYEDEVELQLGDYEIEVRDGKTYAVLKKSKYPKTYAECCDVLSITPYYNLRYYTYEHGYNEYATTNELVALQGKLNILGKLIICCKAYWKIAGEEIGLDKSWDPKYGCGKWGYWIGYDINANKTYCQDSRLLLNRVLVFPTKEMRDMFYENFKELIEQCKELL